MESRLAGYPLSPPQRHVQALGEDAPEAAFCVQCAVAVEGNLDISLLEAACDAVVQRHEILRTTFRTSAELHLPLQVVEDDAAVKLKQLGDAEPEGVLRDPQAHLDALLGRIRARRPWDRQHGPVLDLELLTSPAGGYLLFVGLPALSMDSAGLRLLISDVAACYEALAQGTALPEEPVQYADLSTWMNELVTDGEAPERSFWRKALRGCRNPLRLPFAGPVAGSSASVFVRAILDPEVSVAVEALAERFETSADVVVLAAWQALLSRRSGSAEPVVAVAFDGRSYDELAGALGLFERYVPLGCRIGETTRFDGLVEDLAAATEEAYDAQEYFSWEHLLAEDGDGEPPSWPAHGFRFVDEPEPVTAGNVVFTLRREYASTSRFIAELRVERTGDDLATELHYAAEALADEDAARLLDELRVLLTDAVRRPATAVAELDILAAFDRTRLLGELNDTAESFAPEVRGIHALVEAQAARLPEAPALVHEDEQLTYAELEERSNALARRLAARGAGPESLVVLHLERSLDAIVAVLAVLKTGAAYIPPDPEQPASRLQEILEEVEPLLAVTQDSLAHTLPESLPQLRVDGEPEAGDPGRGFEGPVGDAGNLAYVLFTSGSTGRPKGVAVEHRQLLNYVRSIRQRLDLPERPRFALVSTLAADLGNTALFPALCQGGCVHLISRQRSLDPVGMAEYVERHGVDCLKIVPSHLDALLMPESGAGLLTLRRLIMGGEACRRALVEKVRALTNGEAPVLFNHYGPTETTVGVLTHRLGANEPAAPAMSASLGRPIANTRVYLLDSGSRPVPTWTPGELHVGGAALARGYLRRPRETAERFVPDAVSGEPGARLYRTGDLARHLAGGVLEFVGRVDRQVKLRGFRIELGEIESRLRTLPAVDDAVAVIHQGDDNEQQLVAYVVFAAEAADASDLRETLSQDLPEYMVPALFVTLKALPLTANGKVDRVALPDPAEVESAASESFTAPRTHVEQWLAGIWCQVLEREQVGVEDDFFKLGGHSLLVTGLIARIHEAFGIDLPLTVPFERPVLADLAASIEEAMRKAEGTSLPPIVPRPPAMPRELSFAQQRLWFLHQFDPESPQFNVPSAIRLEGELNVAALAASLGEIRRRHEILRLSYPAVAGAPAVVVAEPQTEKLPVVDLRRLDLERRQAEAERRTFEEACRPMDLDQGPLLRSHLLKLGSMEHVWLFTLHHIICDARARSLLIQELSLIYRGQVTGEDVPLDALTVQYTDYAHWQRQWLAGQVLERQVDFWRRRLAGLAPLDLPTDRPRPAVRTAAGSRVRFTLPPALTEGLKALSRTEGSTLFTVLAAAFQVLLRRLTSQHDFAVGTPVIHRGRPETEALIGFFLNTLVLRTPAARDPSFRELLREVRSTMLEALAHQDVSFEKLVEELQPERELSHTPLFQVLFTLQADPGANVRLPGGLLMEPLEVFNKTSKYDITLFLEERNGTLAGLVEYSTDLFDTTTPRRWTRQYQTLLESALAEPEGSSSTLALLSPAERQQLLREWNDTEAVAGELLPQVFAAQVRQRPNAVAVVGGGESWTYAELDRRANQLANHLRALGVAPESRVGILLKRGPDLLTATLGVFKAGAGYVPLDPIYPPQRLAFMLDDAQVSVLLSEEGMSELWPEGLEVVRLDADREVLDRRDAAAPEIEPASSQLAYLIYTSGSTGLPKGVQISQGALANFLAAMAWKPGLTADDRLFAVTTLSFDIAALELFLPLWTGARVIVADSDEVADAARLAKALASSGASVMQATPATWRLLLEGGWPGDRGLRILCGGEALPPDLAAALGERCAQLWNVYGPTETTVWSATHRIFPSGAVTIGRPLVRTALHVLDASVRPVPVGAPGQLFIGGAGLARGYFGRPGLSAERFVPDPLSRRSGARLYATGDLCRRLADGTVSFLVRIDHQVKLRGFRIELGEIEARLLDHPAVRQAAVVLDGSAVAGPRLAAFFVPSGEAGHTTAELRAFLAEALPDYMVPSAFVELEDLPRTPNNKVDRGALPLSEVLVERASDTPAVAPRTPLEVELATIWGELLGIEGIGVEDSFFELGGHSLLATRLIFRLREALAVEVPLRTLFEHPTVSALAVAVDRLRAEGEAESGLSSLPPIVVDGERRYEPFPLNDVQHAYWIGRSSAFDLGNVGSHTYREIGLRGLDVKHLEHAIQRLVERHDMLRAVVAPDGRQRILREVPPYRVGILDLRALPNDKMKAAFLKMRQHLSHQVMGTDRWPLFEVRVTYLRENRLQLHIGLDYLIADGWSIRLLTRDVARFYADPDLALPPLELSFRDCVLAEVALRDTETWRRSEEYWARRLDTLPPAPELPLVKSPNALTRPRFRRRSGHLEAASWQLLRSRAVESGLTPSGILLAAFSEVLGAWSKNPRFTLNVTLFNRLPLHPQIDDVVGDFTSLNLLAVDASLPGSFQVRARALQERLWEDLEHRLAGGLHAMRELARRQGHSSGALMPVVFTSFLMGDRGEPDEPREAPAPESGGSGQVETSYNITQTPQVWLDHQVTERNGVLRFNWDAVEELFPPGLLDSLFTAYCDLLETLAQRPETWTQEYLPLLPDAELAARQRANATDAPIPPGLLHAAFLRQAAEQGERVAVIDSRRTLSYRELANEARRLAVALRRVGTQPGELVGVVMEKGWEQVVAVLAVLEAGAAYLPIAASLPRERLALLLERGRVRQVLTQPWLEKLLEWPEGLGRLHVTAEDASQAFTSAEPTSTAEPEELAYVIFTSGSTGLPKGVAIDHRGALNTVVEINRRFRVGPEDRVLALSSLSFDLSVYDIFGILAVGAALVIPEATAARNPGRWLELIREHRVTVWNSVPALMEMLAEYASGSAAESLRLVMLSGDWIPVSLPQRVRELTGGAEVISQGGATEASIWSIYYPIETVEPSWGSIPYGWPLTNQRFHVLNEMLAPSPVWVPGQLYIAGIGLAQGYWDDKETTRASFFEHPRTGERLYRTGDLGRYLPGGEIEFLGREDLQVKVQGYRIELGEIEAALERQASVRAGAVSAVGGRGEQRLVAFVVPERDPETAVGTRDDELVESLRHALGKKLPDYMVPPSFLVLASLPLTANGKVDRGTLDRLAEAEASTAAAADFIPPGTTLQRQIADVWQQALGLAHVGIDENFFDLGGDSVKMVQAYRLLYETLGREIPLVTLFGHPTIRALAAALEEEKPQERAEPDEGKQRAESRRSARQRRRGRRGKGR